MKHLKIVLLAFTFVFSVAAIAAPKNDKTPKAPKAHKTHKATKADNVVNKVFTLPRYFKYTGSKPYTTIAIEDPTNWVEVSGGTTTCNGIANFICVLEIDNNESTYIYGALDPHPNTPKVDVSGALQSDVLLAAGLGTPPIVQAVSRTDYSISVNSTKP